MISELEIREAFRDEEFIKGLFVLETPQDVQAALSEKNISLSVEEIVKIRELLIKKVESAGAISDEELEGVAGGVIGFSAMLIISSIAMAGVFAGGGVVIGAGVAGGAWLSDWATGGKW